MEEVKLFVSKQSQLDSNGVSPPNLRCISEYSVVLFQMEQKMWNTTNDLALFWGLIEFQ